MAANEKLPAEIQDCLSSHGIETDLHLTRAPGDATEVARQAVARGYEKVIIAGGNGALNEVVNGLVGSEAALGLIPLGTGNALGHYLGLEPGDIEGACKLIATGRPKRIDLGRINGRSFVCMAGVGLDAKVASEVPDSWKTLLGTHAFVAQFLKTAARLKPWQMEVTIDGRTVSGDMWAVFVCNTAQYTWRVRMAPEAIEDDGQLDFVLFHHCGRIDLLRVAAAIFGRGEPAADQPHMEVVRGVTLRVDAEPPAPWQADGEVGGSTPVECEVEPKALMLIVSDRGDSSSLRPSE